jgi:XTP/dITP diphosphohydrolase
LMKKLLLASGNPGKLRELRALLQDIELELVSPLEIGLELEVEETGDTYAENATIKAQVYARAAGLPVLADDSGLEVDVLGGEPGLHSARFSPHPGASDADRRQLLLDRLEGYSRPWTARFVCTVAITAPNGGVCLREGGCDGEIIPEERGENGFGYDPIFLVAGMSRTMAELSEEHKNRISHRARAVRAAIPCLHKIFTNIDR